MRAVATVGRVTLADSLADWTDVEPAIRALGRHLGVVGDDVPKWVYCTAIPLGDALYRILETLVEARVLERDDSDEAPDIMFRWVFDGDLDKYARPEGRPDPT